MEVLMAYRELPSNKHVVLYNQQGHCERARNIEEEKEKGKTGKEASNRQRKSEFGLVFGVAILRGSM